MSYTIEYNKQIFYIKKGEEKIYFLFIKQGDNNVRDSYTNLRVKDWGLVGNGTEKELWKIIGRRLGLVEGGGLQRAKGWDDSEPFSPEEYIKQYRSKFKNAKPLHTMLDKFSVEVFIYLREEFINEKDKKVESNLRDLIKRYNMKQTDTLFYDKTKIGYTYTIKDSDSLEDFLLNMEKGWKEDYYSGFSIDKESRRKRFW